MNREKTIVRTGFIGIIANIFLAGFKAVIGVLTASIAIILDAVNNLTDALSSVITIITAKLAGRRPDKKHPYGYGRIEYLSTMIISVIILYAGVTSLVESVKKIISPDTPDYTPVSLIIIAVAVAVKIVLGLYVRATGNRVKSDSLIASGKDALLDAVISASTILAAVIFLIWHISLEAWLGAVISLVIIKAGIEMLLEGISSVLGERVDSELSQNVRKSVLSFPEVSGVYDLVIHNYGEDVWIGSVDIEVDEDMTAAEATKLSRRIIQKAAEQNIRLTSVGICGTNLNEAHNAELWDRILAHIEDHPEFIRAYAFSYDAEEHLAYFYVVPDVTIRKTKDAAVAKLRAELEEEFPDIVFNIDTSVEM